MDLRDSQVSIEFLWVNSIQGCSPLKRREKLSGSEFREQRWDGHLTSPVITAQGQRSGQEKDIRGRLMSSHEIYSVQLLSVVLNGSAVGHGRALASLGLWMCIPLWPPIPNCMQVVL